MLASTEKPDGKIVPLVQMVQQESPLMMDLKIVNILQLQIPLNPPLLHRSRTGVFRPWS